MFKGGGCFIRGFKVAKSKKNGSMSKDTNNTNKHYMKRHHNPTNMSQRIEKA